MKSFFRRGPCWVRGMKYGVAIFAGFFAGELLVLPLLIVPFLGVFPWLILAFATTLLSPFERIISSVPLITNMGGTGFFAISIPTPTIFGWIILLVMLPSIGFIVGITIDLFMRPSRKFGFVVGVIYLSIFSSLYFFSFVTTPSSLERCGYMTDGYQARNKSNCYLEYLNRNRDLASLDYCNAHFMNPAGGKDYRSKCFAVVATITRNDKICDSIPQDPGPRFDSFFEGENTILRDECYQGIIGNPDNGSPDVSQCDKRLSEGTRDRCFRSVAVITKDAEICKNVVSLEIKSSCYLWIVGDTHNMDLCNFVRTEDKEKCVGW